jgi:hypothetical protein
MWLSLSPVAEALYAKLNAAPLTALVGGRIYDDIPQNPTYPFVWIEMFGEQDRRGLGTGALPEVDVRVHVFSTATGSKEAQAVMAAVISLLKDQALTITGYTQAGQVFCDETMAFPHEVIAGVKVREIASVFRVYVEPA